MRISFWLACIGVTLLLLAGCGPTPVVTESPPDRAPAGEQPLADEGLGLLIELARADLAHRQGVDIDRIALHSIEEATFSDTSLGVPEPGSSYAQVVTPGYVLRLIVGGEAYTYHGSGERVVWVRDEQAAPEDENPGTIVVALFFHNPSLSRTDDCALVVPTLREIPRSYDLPTAVLERLFAGPTEQEVRQGYVSWFSSASAGALKSVRTEGNTAYIDLADIRLLMPSASTSCGQQAFFAEVETTLRRVRPVERVIYAIEGDPAPFYEWMQLGCSAADDYCDRAPFEDRPSEWTPEQVVADFYRWHLGEGNVLLSRAYRSNEHLSEALIRRVDETIDSFRQGAYDPFLCAQDIPRDMRLDPALVDEDRARVGVHGLWNVGTQYETANDVVVHLQRTRGRWQIVDIECP